MSKEGERCEEEENYSFTYCIRVRKCHENYSGVFLFLEFCQQDGGMSVPLGLLVRPNAESLSEFDSTPEDHYDLQRVDVMFLSFTNNVIIYIDCIQGAGT